MGTDYSCTEPRRHCSRGNETRLECEAAQNQVTAHQHLRPHDRKMRSSGDRFTKERPGEQDTRNALADQIRDSRPFELHTRSTEQTVNENRAQDRRNTQADKDESKRSHRVLNPAHPAVAGQGYQDEWNTQYRYPKPTFRSRGDVGSPGHNRSQRAGDHLHDRYQGQADRGRQPGRLNTLAHRITLAPRSVQPCRARRRPIRQEGQLRTHQRQDQTTDRQPGQRKRPESADHGDVEQQIEGFGCQHPECRKRQGKDSSPSDVEISCRRSRRGGVRFAQCRGFSRVPRRARQQSRRWNWSTCIRPTADVRRHQDFQRPPTRRSPTLHATRSTNFRKPTP